jgi:hypothetical protein
MTYTRVQMHDVHPSFGGHYLVGQTLDRFCVGTIYDMSRRLTPRSDYVIDDLMASDRVDIHRMNTGALAGKEQRSCPTDSRSGSGNDDDRTAHIRKA